MANYLIQSCDNLTSLVIDSGVGTINVGEIYYFTFTATTIPGCFTVIEEVEQSNDDGLLTALAYDSCLKCTIDTPRSANTETIVCYACDSDINNGVVAYYSGSTPHPVWTDGYGTSVTQMNMITLGGINGLNA